MKAMPSIGVALYADGTPFSIEGNVACEYRKSPFEFSAASDLPSQTLWVTNASLNDLISVGLHKSPKIAHEGYYRTRLAQMAQELGITNLPLDQQASLLAEILGNAAEMAKIQLGLTQYPSSGLAQAVGQLYGASEAPIGSAMFQVAEQSCQRYTACERERRYEKADIFSFWMPRFPWAASLLEQPLPNNNDLKVIPPHALPSMGKDSVLLAEWASENKIPLFARVRVHALDPVVGKLVNYGAGAQSLKRSTESGAYEARNMREWCALPELEMLCQFGDVQVIQVACSSGWSRSGLHIFNSRLSAVSYAYGLVAENLWTGLARKPTPTGTVSRTLSTAWLQAIDRMKCLQVAQRLYNMGMEVVNYGNGRITVVCPPSVRALIPQAALEEGMMYPASLPSLNPYRPQPGNPDHILQHLINCKDYARLVSVDQATLKELESARGA